MFAALHDKYRSWCSWSDLENSMGKYYSAEEEKKYGVVGIQIELLDNTHQATLNAYNSNIESYITHTISEPSTILKRRIDKTLEGLALDSSILEVGT